MGILEKKMETIIIMGLLYIRVIYEMETTTMSYMFGVLSHAHTSSMFRKFSV